MKICVPSFAEIMENDGTQMIMIVMNNADGFYIIMTYLDDHENPRSILR